MEGPFFGNSSKKIVHDLNKASLECEIGKVETQYKKYFDPDTLEQARKEGYMNCKYCLQSQ